MKRPDAKNARAQRPRLGSRIGLVLPVDRFFIWNTPLMYRLLSEHREVFLPFYRLVASGTDSEASNNVFLFAPHGLPRLKNF